MLDNSSINHVQRVLCYRNFSLVSQYGNNSLPVSAVSPDFWNMFPPLSGILKYVLPPLSGFLKYVPPLSGILKYVLPLSPDFSNMFETRRKPLQNVSFSNIVQRNRGVWRVPSCSECTTLSVTLELGVFPVSWNALSLVN